jgi:hypothetical protein
MKIVPGFLDGQRGMGKSPTEYQDPFSSGISAQDRAACWPPQGFFQNRGQSPQISDEDQIADWRRWKSRKRIVLPSGAANPTGGFSAL